MANEPTTGTKVGLSILGSSGSIGRSALDIVRAHPDRFRIRGLACGKNLDQALLQAREFRPELLSVDESIFSRVREELSGMGISVQAGMEGACAVAALPDAEVLLSAIVGEAGLAPTWEGIRNGRTVALANKETLVVGGQTVIDRIKSKGARLVPVDSEHSAIYQAMRGHSWTGVRRIVLTASGGPFFGKTRADLEQVTPDQALNHPTWKMGPKITVDSSTLMNKGLEVIEAHLLFDIPYERIDVVVHPQSVVHSMVEMTDGATIAQLSLPDMRLPIGYALAYPDRLDVPFGAIDWVEMRRLEFEPPDSGAFPCLGLAYEAGRRGGTAPACLNGANEVAVASFLSGRLRWVDIAGVVSTVMDRYQHTQPEGIDDVLAADAEGRALGSEEVARRPEPARRRPGGQ